MLETTWFVLWGLLWAVYFVLDGFDFGMGTLLPFLAKNDEEKRIIYNAAGPYWDGNEVWLITAGGVTFAAFPKAYAVMFSALYAPLLILLFALIFRAVSFEFRNKKDCPQWRKFWDACQFLGNFLPALLLGVAFANLFMGIPIAGHSKNPMCTAAVLWRRLMVSMFMALPAGVPTPPMRQAMGSPSITALPKLLVPFIQPFFSSSRTATGSIMATTGMSARMVESSAQTIIRSSRRRTGEPLDRRLVHRTMRRLRPEFWKAMAMQNMANTKKIVGVANSCIILGRGRMPATAGSTANSTEATATGRISNTHTSTAANIMAMARLPLGDSPSGHGRETSRKYPRRMARPMQPFRREVVMLASL